MANIDVSDLLLDPDFVDSLTLIRRSATVNSRGENVITETPLVTVGSIQPISGKQLQRVPEAYRSSDVRSFFVKASFVNDGTSEYPDIILYNNVRFQIIVALPWLNWGQGWNECTAVREALS